MIMELDDIKKAWQEIDALKEKQQINENRIKEMLKKEGKTALSKLIRMAKLGIFGLIPIGIFLCLISYKFFETGGYYMMWPLLMLFLCILFTPFNIYLYRLLKSINYSGMTVKEVSERILKYENIIRRINMYDKFFMIFYVGIWYYLYYKLVFGSKIIWAFIIFMIIMCLVLAVTIPFLYKKLYDNNIDRIKESLKELKEFEDKNI